MNFSDRPPSQQWLGLKFRGQPFAEVWFKPDGEPLGLTFRILSGSFQIPELGDRLTAANLLKAVGVTAEEVESWRADGAAEAELNHPLPAPADEATHLSIHFSLKPPAQAAPDDGSAEEIAEAKWQDLLARWNSILVLEASIDTLRISVETLRAEMEGASRRTLTSEEKVHAFNADVAQWNKAKSRTHHSLPKLRDFIHRSTWAAGTPERKALEELFKDEDRSLIPAHEADRVSQQLDHLLKDRQVLSAHGVTVYQECKGVTAEIQGALRNLQSGASGNANKKRAATIAKGKRI